MPKASLKGYKKIAQFSTRSQAEKAKKSLLNRAMSGTTCKIQKRVNKNTRKDGKKLVYSPTENAVTYMLWAK